MDEMQAVDVLTYLGQLDNRIDLNDSASDMWFYAMMNMEVEKVTWIIRDYYANAKPGFGGGVPPLTPGALKSRINEMDERSASKQRALEPPKGRAPNPVSFRKRDPERWDALVRQGAEERYNELTRRGIKVNPPKHMQPSSQDGGSLYAQGGEQ